MARVYPFTFPNSSKDRIIAKPHFMQEFAMRATALLLSLFVGLTASLHADDGAASIAAGGIIVMKRETRIVMAKEVLTISPSQVLVDYDFRNDSDEDITTEVAFPVPPYKFGDAEEVFGDPGFDDFKLLVGDAPVRFKVETRAFVGKREVTALLAQEHIDAATFGHWDEKDHDYSSSGRDFQKASAAGKRRLVLAGAYDKDNEPNWQVRKMYHWTQTFPAHAIVHIRHRYSPVLGGTNSVSYGLMAKASPPTDEEKKYPDLAANRKQTIDEIDSLCLGAPLEAKLLKLVQRMDMSIPFNYVDFILTTANTWKTPIEDFTLIVDRPKADKSTVPKRPMEPRYNEAVVSFCWDGPVEKTDGMHYTAHLKDFIPTKQLRIGFVYVDQQNPSDYYPHTFPNSSTNPATGPSPSTALPPSSTSTSRPGR